MATEASLQRRSRSSGQKRWFSTPLSRAEVVSRSIVLGKSHFLLTVAMLATGTALHYLGPASMSDAGGPVHLTSYCMNRVLFMVPVVYAGFIFGLWGGGLTVVVATLLMLPKALLMSPSPPDAVLEVLSVLLVSCLIIVWFGGQQRERQRRLEVLSRLELARQELASQVEIIKKNERRLSAIHDVCCVVSESLDLPHVIQRILDEVVDESGVEAAMIFLVNETTRKLELVASKGISADLAGALATLRMGEGFNGRVAASGESMVVEDTFEDPRLAIPEVITAGLRSQLIVPLRSKGAPIGSLCVAVRTSRSFSADDIELLTAIGSQVGIAIENARLYQKALVSEEKYRDLFENATASIFVQDLTGRIAAANKACAVLTGYSLSELTELEPARLFPPPSLAVLAKVQQDLLRGDARGQNYDVRLLRKDGVEITLSMTTRLIREGSRPGGFHHIALDVTEPRRMRDTLNYYMRQVLTAQEEERKRIARELHDETAQSLLLILQRIEGLGYRVEGEAAAPSGKELEELRAVVLQTLSDVRRLTRDLRPQILDDLGPVAAVEWLAEDLERQAGIGVSTRVVGAQRKLATEAQLLLFRIAQEALSNLRRHAGATRASLTLEFDAARVRLLIEDNGRGFRMPESLSDLAASGKLGILGMFERARLAGGSLDIRSEPGQGTGVVVELES